MTIDDLYALVEKSSHETAFNKGEVEAMYICASLLPRGSYIVELGVEYGRSTTVLGVAARERNHHFTAIDAWVQENSEEAKAHVCEVLIDGMGLPIDLVDGDSTTSTPKINNWVDLLHVDGDHTYEGVMADLIAWYPEVKKGGFILFDDYGHDSLPGVIDAVTDFQKESELDFIGRFGNKLGIFRKI